MDIGIALSREAIHDSAFETFEADRFKRKYRRHMIRSDEHVRKAKGDQGAMSRAVNEPEFGFHHDGAGPFCSNQGVREVEILFRQKLIQVIAGYASRDLGITGTNTRGVLVAQGKQPLVDLAASAAVTNRRLDLRVCIRGKGKLRAVVEYDLQLLYIVYGLPAE